MDSFSNTPSTLTTFATHPPGLRRTVVSRSDHQRRAPSLYPILEPSTWTPGSDPDPALKCRRPGHCLGDSCVVVNLNDNPCQEGLSCLWGFCEKPCMGPIDCWIGKICNDKHICVVAASKVSTGVGSRDSTLVTSASTVTSDSTVASDSTVISDSTITSAFTNNYTLSTTTISNSTTPSVTTPSLSTSAVPPSSTPSPPTKHFSKLVYLSIPVIALLLAVIGLLLYRRHRKKDTPASRTLPAVPMNNPTSTRGPGTVGLGTNTGAWSKGHRQYRTSASSAMTGSRVPRTRQAVEKAEDEEMERVMAWLRE